MIRRTLLSLAALAVMLVTISPSPASIRDRIRERLGQRLAEQVKNDQTLDGREMAYGSDPLQTLSFWSPTTKAAKPAPLILFVHGGGWKRGDKSNATGKAKIAHFTGQAYAVASINYRLVPDATVEQQAQDVASALAYVRTHAADLGIDPARIVLMGHSAGAHLVALVGTDPQYLKAAGLDETAVAGIVPIDGAAYDVPRQVEIGAWIMGPTYSQAFGTDPARQRAISPTFQAAAPNTPAYLILHVQRRDGIVQSQGLADALRKAGTSVEIESFEGTGLQGHMDINRKLGLPDYPATPVVDRWLKARFGA